ncbi:alpha-1,2-fucosyltransferase [Aeromonas sp. FDAARGOS 1409]|uniref:alpha-1,2-fucosyltransferase n=1 Tax=Aeromonas TaxID=642 RepID=UPI001C216ACD|nr:alpha-1,2-fucosyltransferase [Aeromonas sp. FDAARGOS 1409]QXC30074.1 alpha-1,2-fucosyltransferase [Aeromonas sp. FDAARGOS 1409]
MKNIYLRISGGLGNQLYQFSFAYYLFRKFNYDRIVIDTSGMKNYNEYWGFLLYEVLSKEELDKFVIFKSHFILKFRLPKLSSRLGVSLSKYGFFSDEFNEEDIGIHPLKDNLFLDGYFETVRVRNEYFKLLKPIIRCDLNMILPDNLVVINVRGGEFLRLGLSTDDDREYYKHAISNIMKKVKEPIFHVITDDVNYASSLLDGLCEIDEIHKPNPRENFKYIMNSKYKVLSLSTFAKWAAIFGGDAHIYWKSGF